MLSVCMVIPTAIVKVIALIVMTSNAITNICVTLTLFLWTTGRCFTHCMRIQTSTFG